MPPIDYPPVQQALDALRELSADPEIQRLAAVRERVLREQYWVLAGEREEGRAAGYAQGEAQGITQGQATPGDALAHQVTTTPKHPVY